MSLLVSNFPISLTHYDDRHRSGADAVANELNLPGARRTGHNDSSLVGRAECVTCAGEVGWDEHGDLGR